MCGNVLNSLLSTFGVADPGTQSAPAPQQDTAHDSDADVKVATEEAPAAPPRRGGKVRLSGKKREGATLPGLGL